MIARAIVAGEDIREGDVLYEKDGRGYCIRNLDSANQRWLGFAKKNALKGESVTFGPQLDLVGG